MEEAVHHGSAAALSVPTTDQGVGDARVAEARAVEAEAKVASLKEKLGQAKQKFLKLQVSVNFEPLIR